MLANIKFKVFEDLKMTRAEGYSYDKFLSDSSDDENVAKKYFVIKQAHDDMNYQQAYSQTEVRTALEEVLILANERAKQFQSPELSSNDSIQIVKEYFFNSGQSVINNSQIAKSDKDN